MLVNRKIMPDKEHSVQVSEACRAACAPRVSSKNKSQKSGMFFGAESAAITNHVFTAILHPFTTQNTTLNTPVFSKPP
jgi:hypothetical protein